MKMSSTAIAHAAQRESRNSLSEDRKVAKEELKTAFTQHVEAQKNAIAEQRVEAQKRDEANAARNDGGFLGGLFGSILGGLAIAAGIFCLATGVGAAVGVALLGVGAACIGAGTSIGTALAAPGAGELESLANQHGDRARELQLEATKADRQRAQQEARFGEVSQQYRQALDDARKELR
jgi:hypothetical protein